MPSRRRFLTRSSQLSAAALAALTPSSAASVPQVSLSLPDIVDLDGEWLFRPDPDAEGDRQNWQAAESRRGWRSVTVPHTWQIEPSLADYRGLAWYHRNFFAPDVWRSSIVRIEFEAVFHSATVWVNGKLAGSHLRKGYTAFALNITPLLNLGAMNTIAVKVDNAFNEHMLPRGRSSDWAHDGGIYRPVHLIVTPPLYIERAAVDAIPDFETKAAAINASVYLHNAGSRAANGRLSFRIIDEKTGLPAVSNDNAASFSVLAGQTQSVSIRAGVPNARLWHFDHPNLYRLEVSATSSDAITSLATTFGVRKLEVRDGRFFFNGEPVRLMGVERMAGSNPEFGMAEPSEWIDHDHADLKHLNCIFTRVHWPQDKRVLDYCDRHGILMQSEVPTWGPATFKGMGNEPDADIIENGREQFREMLARDGNHPCIVSWGLCNEIGGQNPPAYSFAKHMLEEAKRLDPHRLCSYASHSLRTTPAKDVAGLMDFIECNEYFGTWYPGGPETVSQSLDEIHAAFPDKPIVISEYGYCACTADRPEGDEHRIRILDTHDAVFRKKPYIGGLIFFCYNDYRTHVGDRGSGVMKQRVHGVVDLYGARKPSYEALRSESSPIESMDISGSPVALKLILRTRNAVPAYTLRGYKLRGLYYGFGEIPTERKEIELPDLSPDQELKLTLEFSETRPWKVEFDVLRPTGFSAYSRTWKL
ncbi:MAG TPA: glycoside hydrolase family 2 TIM barrel-domain containing protein [Bryobacteraceae bacterium]